VLTQSKSVANGGVYAAYVSKFTNILVFLGRFMDDSYVLVVLWYFCA